MLKTVVQQNGSYRRGNTLSSGFIPLRAYLFSLIMTSHYVTTDVVSTQLFFVCNYDVILHADKCAFIARQISDVNITIFLYIDCLYKACNKNK